MNNKSVFLSVIILILIVLVFVFGFIYYKQVAERQVPEKAITPSAEDTPAVDEVEKKCPTIADELAKVRGNADLEKDFYKRLYLEYYNDNRIENPEKSYSGNKLTFYFSCLGVILDDKDYCNISQEIEDELLRSTYSQELLEGFGGYLGSRHTCELVFNQNGYFAAYFLNKNNQINKCGFNIKERRDKGVGFSNYQLLDDCGIDYAVLDDLFCDTYYYKNINTEKINTALADKDPFCQYILKSYLNPNYSNCNDAAYKLEEKMELIDCETLQEQSLSMINNDSDFCSKIDSEFSKRGMSEQSCKIFHNFNVEYCIGNFLEKKMSDETCINN